MPGRLENKLPFSRETMRIPIRCSLLTALVTASTISAGAAAPSEEFLSNWPQWRGPTGNGVALTGNPPVEWSETKNVKWKTAIPGEGHSSPVIWNDRIFLMTAVPTGVSKASSSEEPRGRRGGAPTEEMAFTTVCIDRNSGRVLWEKVGRAEVPHEGKHNTNTFSSGSPVTDGELVYSFFGSRGLYCYDFDGGLIWEKDLGKIQTRNSFGEGTSPAVHGDTLVVLQDSEGASYLHAFNKKTGAELWKVSREERTGWTTPYILEYEGKQQVIVNATGTVCSYDLATGDLLWSCSGQTANAIPSIVADLDTVYAMSGYRGSSAMAIKLGSRGELSPDSDAIRWKLGRGTPYVPSPMLSGDFLFFCKGNSGVVTCVNPKTGEVYFSEERVAGVSGVYASPVGVADRIYLASQEGNVAVIRKSAEFEILATNSLADPIDASPAVVGDELFLRTHRNLYCIAE